MILWGSWISDDQPWFFLAFLARASLRGHGRTAAFQQLFYDSSVPFSEIQCLSRSLNFKLVHPLLIYKSPIFSWKLSHLFRQLSDWSLQEIWPCGEQHRCVGRLSRSMAAMAAMARWQMIIEIYHDFPWWCKKANSELQVRHPVSIFFAFR